MSENPYEPPRLIEAALQESHPPESDEEIRLKHLRGEARIRILSLIYDFGALLWLLLFFFSIMKNPLASIRVAELKGTVAMGAPIFLFAATGIGLRKYRTWARVTAFVSAIPLLIFFPMGTILGAFVLIVISDPANRTIFSPGYRQIISSTPHLKPKGSKRFKVMFAAVMLFCAVTAILIYGLLDGSH